LIASLAWTAASGVALAGPPPAGLSLDDPFAWDAVARAVVDGPPGCRDAQGIARVRLTLHQMPDRFGAARDTEIVLAGRVAGTLRDGRWDPITVDMVQITPPPDPAEPPSNAGSALLPLIGSRSDKRFTLAWGSQSVNLEGDEIPLNLIRDVIDRWGGREETVFAEWDASRDGVWVRRQVPVREGSRETSQVSTLFPGGGTIATALDVTFPRVVHAGSWPARVKLQNAQMHIRQEARDGVAWPTLETTSVIASVLGFQLGIEQTIQWQGWAPCGGTP
jgi:hypothetical protein